MSDRRQFRMKTTTAKTTTAAPVFLGVGVLNWSRSERVSDRYGIVYLGPESGGYDDTPAKPEGQFAAILATIDPLEREGQKGDLIAVVKATRKSGHIGDLFRGVGPRTPKVGQRITLGTGALVFESVEGIEWKGVGVKPDRPDAGPWMKLRALYDCHDQTVELWFHPHG